MLEATVTCVVPARLGSTRFPRKLLQPLLGKPIVVHALERASEAGCFADVVCFTDSLEIGEAVAEHGFRFVLTGEAANGTERIGRNLDAVATDLVVNLQGDEPAFPMEGLQSLCDALNENPEWVHTLVHEEPPTDEDMMNRNRVKAVMDADGFVVDFVRKIPAVAEWPADGGLYRGPAPTTGDISNKQGGLKSAPTNNTYRVHLGAYGYSKNFLRRYVASPVSQREIEMSHELLRNPDLAPIRAHASPPGSPVDVPADLAIALERLESMLMLQGV